MRRVKVLLICFCVFVSGIQAWCQTEEKESQELTKKKQLVANNAVLISPYYSALFPLGELKHRFGFSNNIGLNLSLKVKRNWLIGIEGAYLFGTVVKEDPLTQIATGSTGQIIGTDGSLGSIPLQLSGFMVSFRVSKIIALSKKHPNSGIVLSVAPGFIQHKIWINANTNNFPQLDPTYLKGYDRMTNGPMISGGIGYVFLEKKKFLSFYGGVDFAMGFTQERRNWNFDLMSADKHQRMDMMIGLRLAWNIPVFLHKHDDNYYY